MDNGAVIRVRITIGADRAQRDGRLHRHQRAAGEQLQRALRRRLRRGALRLPHAGRRRHPAERGLPQAARGRDPRGLDAQPAAARRRRSRATSRPRSASPTRSMARWACMAASYGTMNNFTFGNDRYQYYETISGGTGAGRRLRRHRRGADAHDQLAAHRPGGARVALSRCASTGTTFARAAAARAAGTAATARARRVRFLEPMTAAILAGPPPHPALRHGGRLARASSAATGWSAPTAPARSSRSPTRPR